MKKTKSILVLAMVALFLFSCKKEGCTDPTALNYSEEAKKDDGSCKYPTAGENTKIVTGHITENTTWTADKIWELAGKIVVEDGVTLTIEPGTIIKGREGTGTLASALIVAKGGKIMAEGTASQPIVFTSVLDNIKVGESSGSNLDTDDSGLWGGVILLGKAPVSSNTGDDIAQIEGIPTSENYGSYGGNDSQDNSGVLKYVSIRHCGALIGAGNEINGLTLGGVGSGTTIENIEILGTIDDGIELFGGTVDVENVLVYHQGDDGIDIDQNYAGRVANFTVVSGANSGSGLEIDGPEGSTHTGGLFILENGTLTGVSKTADFKSRAQGTIINVTMGVIEIAASYETDCSTVKEDAFAHLMDANPTLIFTNSSYDAYEVYTKSVDGSGGACGVPAADNTIPSSVLSSSTSATGNTTQFSWSWTAQKGLL